jgi:predicted nucleotidyltransferase
MNRFGLSDQDLAQILRIIFQHKNVTSVKIFGSRAMGNFKKGSDIDIAMFGTADLKTLSQIKFALEEQTVLPYFFDVVLYDTIESVEFRKHIEDFGVELTP